MAVWQKKFCSKPIERPLHWAHYQQLPPLSQPTCTVNAYWHSCEHQLSPLLFDTSRFLPYQSDAICRICIPKCLKKWSFCQRTVSLCIAMLWYNIVCVTTCTGVYDERTGITLISPESLPALQRHFPVAKSQLRNAWTCVELGARWGGWPFSSNSMFVIVRYCHCCHCFSFFCCL